MEKYSIEIETSLGWINYHMIMRPGLEKAMEVLAELSLQHPGSRLRIVRWTGEPL
jgi:hypothetical protein